jgi:hypothetical protein
MHVENQTTPIFCFKDGNDGSSFATHLPLEFGLMIRILHLPELALRSKS